MCKNMILTRQKNRKIIIAGPCAIETKEQALESIYEAKGRMIDFIRMSLWKPRTKPGFDGLGREGISLLIEAVKQGLNPATEVLMPDQAKMVIEEINSKKKNAKLLLWIGSRNQNHFIQREIAKVIASYENVYLMLKNQPWSSFEHWEGMIRHVSDAGVRSDRLIICHRGFTPEINNPRNYRNIPDFDMAMKIKALHKLPVIFDPSHTGGNIINVIDLTKESAKYNFDGMILEVHPYPEAALTDAKQQLTWPQFDDLLKLIY